MVNNLDDFCVDVYASHLLRTSFQCAAGVRVEERQHKKALGPTQAKIGAGELNQKSHLHDDDERKQDLLSILSMAVAKVKEIENISGSLPYS